MLRHIAIKHNKYVLMLQHIAIKYNKHVLNMLPALPYRIGNIATIICDRFSLNCDYIFCRKLY